MRIYTYYAPQEAKEFRQLKRKATGEWRFLISGEWFESPYHHGSHRFFVRSSRDKCYWALLSVGVPNRIVAVANTPKPVALEVVAAAMMRKVKLDGGDYIGLVHEHGRINWSMLWELYRKKATGAARNRSGSSGSKSAMDSVDDPLSALLAMPLHARIVAVSKDVRSKADRFGKINAFELAEALKVPQPEMPSGEWTFTSYAEQKSLEEYVDAGGEVSDILDWLVANVSPRRLVTLRKIFGAHIGSAASRSFEFLTSKERRCVEDIIAKRALEANQSNGMNCVASYCVSSGKVQLRFEADVEDDGSCVFLRTPYDERDGRFRDLSNCVIDEW